MSEKMYNPVMWEILDLSGYGEPLFKVFGTWTGGYLDGDSWRLNSGIRVAEDMGDHWLFYGFSGSIYRCFKGSIGTSMFTEGVLARILEYPEVRRIPKDEVPRVIQTIMEGSE